MMAQPTYLYKYKGLPITNITVLSTKENWVKKNF